MWGEPSTLLSFQKCLACHEYTVNDPNTPPCSSHRCATSLSMQPSGSQIVSPEVLSRGTFQLGVQSLECIQSLCWKATDCHCCCNDSYSSNNSWFVCGLSFCGHDQNPAVKGVCWSSPCLAVNFWPPSLMAGIRCEIYHDLPAAWTPTLKVRSPPGTLNIHLSPTIPREEGGEGTLPHCFLWKLHC